MRDTSPDCPCRATCSATFSVFWVQPGDADLRYDRPAISSDNSSSCLTVAQSDAPGVPVGNGLVDFMQIPSPYGYGVGGKPQLQGALVQTQLQLQEQSVRERDPFPRRLETQEQSRGFRAVDAIWPGS